MNSVTNSMLSSGNKSNSSTTTSGCSSNDNDVCAVANVHVVRDVDVGAYLTAKGEALGGQRDETSLDQATDVPAVDKFVHQILAFDFMHLSFRDLMWAPALTPLLELAFPAAAATATAGGTTTSTDEEI